MAEIAKKSTVEDWLRFYLDEMPLLSSDGKARFERTTATLHSDGVDIGYVQARQKCVPQAVEHERARTSN
jgi:hypothetical protein